MPRKTLVTEGDIEIAAYRMEQADFDDVGEDVVEFMRTAALEKLRPAPVDLPENSLILAAFQNEPVNFLLSNALRHLTLDQQRQLCNALLERLPTPASIEDEAERLYPNKYKNGEGGAKGRHYMDFEIADLQRSAHISCARQYMDTIEKLRAENAALIEEIQNWKDELKDQAREHRNNR